MLSVRALTDVLLRPAAEMATVPAVLAGKPEPAVTMEPFPALRTRVADTAEASGAGSTNGPRAASNRSRAGQRPARDALPATACGANNMDVDQSGAMDGLERGLVPHTRAPTDDSTGCSRSDPAATDLSTWGASAVPPGAGTSRDPPTACVEQRRRARGAAHSRPRGGGTSASTSDVDDVCGVVQMVACAVASHGSWVVARIPAPRASVDRCHAVPR